MLIIKKVKNRIGTLILNRSEMRNALDSEMIGGLLSGLEEMEKDPGVKVVIIKGQGTVFCSGADLSHLKKIKDNSYPDNLSDSRQLASLFQKIFQFPKVVIAQVEGSAIAGGCGLALVCDFVFAVPEAKFGFPEVKIGFLPALVMVFAREKLGAGITRNILLAGNLFDTAAAKILGLVYEMVPKEKIETHVNQFATHLVQDNSEQSMTDIKEMLVTIQGKNFYEAIEFAAIKNAKARKTAHFEKGLAAFLSKEKMRW
ncbi:MAG: enoyl-CoA hydratase-related protein [Cyclobacteriaceae bacterium]